MSVTNKIVPVETVACYILEKIGEISGVRLQKLCYYSQAWHLVILDRILFQERIEAWANGPVIPDLYQKHKLQYPITKNLFDEDPKSKKEISEDSLQIINEVLKIYGDFTSQQLSNLSHTEEPWINARKGLGELERGTEQILLADMVEYYSSLKNDL